MITSLSIKNVVLIDALQLDFQSGLCVFTGETGAGKSILLDSISLVLGAKTEPRFVRHGQEMLSITATFEIKKTSPIIPLLDDQDIDIEDELVLKRTITKDGKSKAFINNESVSLSFLKSVGAFLVEIHGQFMTHGLLNPDNHMSLLDKYGKLGDLKEKCKTDFLNFKTVEKKYISAQNKLDNSDNQKDFLAQSIDELTTINIQENEEETLTQKRTLLMNSEKIITHLNTAYQTLNQDTQGIITQTAHITRLIEKVNDLSDEKAKNIAVQLDQAYDSLIEASALLENITQDMGDISDLPDIDNRLFNLRALSRKYNVTIDELPALLDNFKTELASLESGQDNLDEIKKQMQNAYQIYQKSAENLSLKRQETAHILDKAILGELPALKLEKATFKTCITPTNGDETGIDDICFMASTNKGIPLAPLNKVASGGELARFMLALKVNLANSDDINTLIFDEVDSGVGGAVADAVGNRLHALSATHQVLVVTHSPQVASYGQHHFHVAKSQIEADTITSVTPLTHQMRQDEIARMLSGATITNTAKTMAGEMLKKHD